ncbi:MAG: hypothetical protein VCA73_09735 [Roseibacillus sp.]|jgi:hypothetical protein
MTSTTTPLPATSPRKRLPLVLITNVCVAVILLAAIPVINKGQQGFAPHAVVNKEYINSAINSGEAEFMNRALKTTEIARAMAHDNHLSTMNLMQVSIGALAVLFFFNSFILFRIYRQPQPASISRGT